MTVTHEPDQHRFVVRLPGGSGVLSYAQAGPGRLDLQHTFVDEPLRGHDVGDALVRAALDYARASDQQIIPTCPFVHRWLARHPDQRDLEAPDR